MATAKGKNVKKGTKGFIEATPKKPTVPTAAKKVATKKVVTKKVVTEKVVTDFVRTNTLPETEFPKCIMLENYSGVHFWTTFKDGNPRAARDRIENFIYNSDRWIVAALYERIPREVEEEVKAGKPRSFIYLDL